MAACERPYGQIPRRTVLRRRRSRICRTRGHAINSFWREGVLRQIRRNHMWGKDLYTYLSDVYQNHAIYTVMFISEAYKKKLWTNHERMSAQARAFSESKEYILPAFFNEAVEVPGVLKTTGRISLVSLTPEELAEKITKKLRDHGVLITVDDRFRYPPTLKQISTSLSPTMIRLRKSSVLSSLPIGIFRVRRSTRYFSSTGPSSLQIKFSF